MHRHTPEAPSFGILKQIRPGRNRQHRNLRPFPHSLTPFRTLAKTSSNVSVGVEFGPWPIRAWVTPITVAQEILVAARKRTLGRHICPPGMGKSRILNKGGPCRAVTP